MLHIDGASNAQCSGAGLILINFEGVIAEYALRFNFKILNNQAEYEALLAGLKIVKELNIDSLKVFIDSQLIAGQVKDEFEIQDPIMMKYFQKMKDLVSTLKYFEIFHILRIKNARADVLRDLQPLLSIRWIGHSSNTLNNRILIKSRKCYKSLMNQIGWI